jgi:hypothetical protein
MLYPPTTPPPTPPRYRQLSPPLYGSIASIFGRDLYYGWIAITYSKKQRKNSMFEEPSHVNLLSLNHVCKIGLKTFNWIVSGIKTC